MLGNTLGATKIQQHHPSPKRKRKRTWAPWVYTASRHWLKEMFLPSCVLGMAKMDVYLSMEWQSLNIHPLAERNFFCLSCVLGMAKMDVYLSMEWQSLNIHPLAERNVFASCVLFHIHPWQGHEPWMYN